VADSSHVVTFLAINGTRITASCELTEQFVLGLCASGTFDFKHLNQWLRDNASA
jgi:prophage maintenance system killer protein